MLRGITVVALVFGSSFGCSSGDRSSDQSLSAGAPALTAGAQSLGAPAGAQSVAGATPNSVGQAGQPNMQMVPGRWGAAGEMGLMAGSGAAGMGPGTAGTGAAGMGASGMGPASGGTGAAMGAAGTGAAGMGAAGAGGTADSSDPCGPDAKPVTGMTRSQGNGYTYLRTSGNVEFVSVRGTLTVPSNPMPARGTLFLWPGLQPLQMDQTVGYGVLQPVLTWGTSCAPGAPSTYDDWWISGVYVGTTPGSWNNITCKGGDVMKVDVGDKLDIEMVLNGTKWTQNIVNLDNDGQKVEFTQDLKGQKQQWLIYDIELKSSTKPVDDVIFSSVVVKLSDSQPTACVPQQKGANDFFAPPRVSADGKTCCISKLILRASGVMASSPNTP